jgi:serpin B
LACNSGESTDGPSTSADIACNGSPDAAAADQTSLENSNADFALDLYRALIAPGSDASASGTSNVFVSPYSLSTALAMTYVGAQGATATEMASALHFSLSQDRVAPAFGWLEAQIAARGKAATADRGKPFTLRQANAMWGYGGEHFVPSFVATLASDFCSPLMTADFVDDPEGCRTTINQWTSAQTDGEISQILPAGAIDMSTRLVLVDALYFAASWAGPFLPSATLPAATFTRLDGTGTQVDMMQQTGTFSYASGTGYQAIELPYDGESAVMDVLLPTAGSEAAFEAGLTEQSLASILSALQPSPVALSLPKFQVAGSSTDLVPILEQLGIEQAFGLGADFSGVAQGPDPLFVAHVFHEADVKVDENGTAASAATAVVFDADGGVSEASAPPPPVPMIVDRSFVVAIRDVPTGTILFLGRIADPNG